MVAEGVVAVAFLLASFQTRPTAAAPRREADLPTPARRELSSERRGLLGRRRSKKAAGSEAGDDDGDSDDEPDPLRALRS